MNISFFPDATVDSDGDARLRALLSACFTDPCFRVRRFCHEMPGYRWLVTDPATGGWVAHLAGHDKVIGHPGGELRIFGVAEVCVLPDHRGRGHVRGLLAAAHSWASARRFPFAMLFGRREVYESSGYVAVDNPIRRLQNDGSWDLTPMKFAMARPLLDSAPPWPDGLIDLRGPLF